MDLLMENGIQEMLKLLLQPMELPNKLSQSYTIKQLMVPSIRSNSDSLQIMYLLHQMLFYSNHQIEDFLLMFQMLQLLHLHHLHALKNLLMQLVHLIQKF